MEWERFVLAKLRSDEPMAADARDANGSTVLIRFAVFRTDNAVEEGADESLELSPLGHRCHRAIHDNISTISTIKNRLLEARVFRESATISATLATATRRTALLPADHDPTKQHLATLERVLRVPSGRLQRPVTV